MDETKFNNFLQEFTALEQRVVRDFPVYEKRLADVTQSIADLQKQGGILESKVSNFASLQAQIGSLNSRLDGIKRNADDRLKVLESPKLESKRSFFNLFKI